MARNIAVVDAGNIVTGVYVVEDDYVVPEGTTAYDTQRANIGDAYDPAKYPTTGFANDEPRPEPDPVPEIEPLPVRMAKLEGQVAEILELLKKKPK